MKVKRLTIPITPGSYWISIFLWLLLTLSNFGRDLHALDIKHSSDPPELSVKQSGPIEIVFDHDKDACENWDIPDEGARAFRDFKGDVHLMDSGAENRDMIGKSLNSVKRTCAQTYRNSHSSDPSTFDNAGWLETFYTTDGKTIYALISHDYHPWVHKLPCAGKLKDTSHCWYSNITYAVSHDGGATYTSPPSGEPRFVAGSAHKFDPQHPGSVGAFVVSNIIQLKGWYYVFVSVGGAYEQVAGDCLMRTKTLDKPSSWRAWDGKDFSVQFADPYARELNPNQHVCRPVAPTQLKGVVRSFMALKNDHGFLITMEGATTGEDGKRLATILASSSRDLIHWSDPIIVKTSPTYTEAQCTKNPSAFIYTYPSMLDPDSQSMNFNTVGDKAYVYLTRFRGCHTFIRDLVRFPVLIEVGK